jgi:cysteine-rich repeat protein
MYPPSSGSSRSAPRSRRWRDVLSMPPLLVIAACALAPPVPEVAFDCTADAPVCPAGHRCVFIDDGDGRGGCEPEATLDPDCTRRDDDQPEVVRFVDDGTACGDPLAEHRSCIAGACVALACGDPSRRGACGDGCVDATEGCDDGNRSDGDGCSQSCRVEEGWVCPGGSAACAPVCLDGRVVGNEACDDGTANPADGCDANCQPTRFVIERFVDGNLDGVSAREIPLQIPLGVTAAADGRIYIADSRNHRVLRFDPRQEPRRDGRADAVADVVVLAGTGVGGFSGDEGPAREAELCAPSSVAVDPSGNVFIADMSNHRIRLVDRSGTITTIAGKAPVGRGCGATPGRADRDDSEILATAADFNYPIGVVIDPRSSDLYVLDALNLRVRRLRRNDDGRWSVRTVLGRSGEPGRTATALVDGADVRFGDGSASEYRQLGIFFNFGPMALSIAPDGDLVVGDTFNHGVVRAEAACFAAECAEDGVAGRCDACQARFERLPGQLPPLPFGVHGLADGRVVVADFANRQVLLDGTPVVASRTPVVSGLDEPAPSFDAPGGLTSVGEQLFVLEPNLGRLTRITGVLRPGATRVLTHVLGGRPTNSTEAEATAVPLFRPAQLALDRTGALYVMDSLNLVVRRYSEDADGRVTTAVAAGTGQANILQLFGGDFAPPTGGCADGTAFAASFDYYPQGMTIVPTPSRDVVLVADPVKGKVVRVEEDGRVCDVLTTEQIDQRFEPQFLHVRGQTLSIVDQARNNWRLVRVALDDQLRPLAATLEVIDLPDVASLRDALPIDDDVTLLTDPRSSVVWRYDHGTDVLEPWVGVPGVAGNDGGSAERSAARLLTPFGLAACPDGRIVITDGGCANNEVWDPSTGSCEPRSAGSPLFDVGVRVRFVSADGTRVETLAGSGERGITGDHGPAVAARVGLSRIDELSLGVVCRDDGSVFFSEADGNRVRIVAPDGTITTYAGLTAPPGPAPSPSRARLYGPTIFAGHLPAAPPSALIVVDGGVQPTLRGAVPTVDDGAGRVVVVDAAAGVRVAAGYERAHVEVDRPLARRAPLLLGARGAVWDAFVPEAPRLVVTQSKTATLRTFDVRGHLGDAPEWLELPPTDFGETALSGLGGIALDPRDGTFAVVDTDNHCVRRLSRDLAKDGVLFGTCEPTAPGDGDRALSEPTHLAFSAAGVLFVADTGNNRVVRIDDPGVDAIARVVVGNGERASAGEGAPAALQAVREPRQIVFDQWHNLYVASTTTVRVVVNGDGDDDGPDGDDPVFTTYGADRRRYPESDANCVEAVAVAPDSVREPGPYGPAIVVGDSCLGTAALLSLQAGAGEDADTADEDEDESDGQETQ